MIDVTKIIYASTLDTFKNLPSVTGSIDVPNQSYTAGQYRTFSTSINLLETGLSILPLVNFSYLPNNWYYGAYVQTNPNANFSAQTRMTISGTNLDVDVFVANQTGGTVSVPAFTLTISVRRFLPPFN